MVDESAAIVTDEIDFSHRSGLEAVVADEIGLRDHDGLDLVANCGVGELLVEGSDKHIGKAFTKN